MGTFSLFNAKVNRKRPQVVEISCLVKKLMSRNRMVMSKF